MLTFFKRDIMKKAAIAVTLALCTFAFAEAPKGYNVPENYTFVTVAESGNTTYVDYKTIKREGKYVKAWTFWTYVTPQRHPATFYKAMRSLDYFDCEASTFYIKAADLYSDGDASKSPAHSQNNPLLTTQFVDIPPGTVIEHISEEVCKAAK